MAKVNFNKDFINIDKNEEFVLNSLLSVYELITRKSFFRRWTLRTHRLTRTNRLAFYHRAVGAAKSRRGISLGFKILAEDAERIINRRK